MSIDTHTFGLKVMSINGVFFDDRCRNVILPCIDGEMSLMAHHEEMFLAIYDGTMRIQKEDNSWIEAVVGIGSAQMANNRCMILIDTVERPEDIDIRRAQEALEAAEEKIRQKKAELQNNERPTVRTTIANVLQRTLRLSA